MRNNLMREDTLCSTFFTWDIHYKCNYYCAYCFLHFEKETSDINAVYLEPERWIGIWGNIYKKHGPCHIHITGGEPFTYPGFMDLVSELSKMHTFEFSTNFSFNPEDFTNKLSPDKVKIDPSFHPEFVEPEAFMDKYLRLRNIGFQLRPITVVAYPPFLKKIPGYKDVFERSGIQLIIYPYRGPYRDRIFPDGYNEDEKGLLESLLGTKSVAKVSSELMESYSQPVKGSNRGNPERKLCRMGQRYAKIIPNGEAFRCCAAVWTSVKTWSNWGGLGNIINDTFSLLSEPELCNRHPDGRCVCHKAMIIGEESKWSNQWAV